MYLSRNVSLICTLQRAVASTYGCVGYSAARISIEQLHALSAIAQTFL